jgi:hypothetical protein
LGCFAVPINLPFDRGIDRMLAAHSDPAGRAAIEPAGVPARAVSDTGSLSLQHIPGSAPPKLDFVEFVATETVVALNLVADLAALPAFTAAVAAYRWLLPLGVCGFFCWPTVHRIFRPLAEEPLLDYLRVAAYCGDLPAGDPRRIAFDLRAARHRFPAFFRTDEFPFGPQRAAIAASRMAEIGAFAARHEFRAAGFSDLRKHDEAAYLAYLDRPEGA